MALRACCKLLTQQNRISGIDRADEPRWSGKEVFEVVFLSAVVW
jgi:hypothetical protein